MYHMNNYSMKALTLYSLLVALFSLALHSSFKLTYPLIEFNLFHSACKIHLQFSLAFPWQGWRAFHLFSASSSCEFSPSSTGDCCPSSALLLLLFFHPSSQLDLPNELFKPLQHLWGGRFCFVLLGARTYTRLSLEVWLNSLLCVADKVTTGKVVMGGSGEEWVWVGGTWNTLACWWRSTAGGEPESQDSLPLVQANWEQVTKGVFGGLEKVTTELSWLSGRVNKGKGSLDPKEKNKKWGPGNMTISSDMMMVMMGEQFRKAVQKLDSKQKYLLWIFLPADFD